MGAFTSSLQYIMYLRTLKHVCLGSCPLNFVFGEDNYKGKHSISRPAQTNETIQLPCKYGGGDVFVKCVMGKNGESKWLLFDQSSCKAKTDTSNQLLDLKQVNVHNTVNKPPSKVKYRSSDNGSMDN